MRYLKRFLVRFLLFLVLVDVTLTFSVSIYTRAIEASLMRSLTQEEITQGAFLVFVNAFTISLFFAVFDHIVYRLTVERDVRSILDFTNALALGDFGRRIRRKSGLQRGDFALIADNLDKLSAELAGMQVMRNDFAAALSHEFKTPLAIIRNYAELYRYDNRSEYVERILATTERVSSLVADVLYLCRLDSQQICPGQDMICLSETVREAVIGYVERIEEKGLELSVDISGEIYLKSDANLISMMVSNLVSNALKFTSRGTITISLEEEAGRARVSVRDTGCGIDREKLPRIFDRYYRAGSGNEGNGLGLALVKRIADLLHVDIEVESVPGSGSCFSLFFPMETKEKHGLNR